MTRGLDANFAINSDAVAPGLFQSGLTQWRPGEWPVAQGWDGVKDDFLRSPVGQSLGAFISARLATGAEIYPAQPLRALDLTPLAKVSVVILGQDPYHGPGQAEGLSFSVAPGVKVPPSLRNIYKELQRDLGRPPSPDGSLVHWAQQGVLLLNTCLTVEKDLPASHAKKGWEALTDAVIQAVAMSSQPTVFMLWGGHAQAKNALLTELTERGGPLAGHLVLCANHPSPLAALRPPRPFIGCGHFRQANDFLSQHGRSPINW
jgi:uracil-DNA glycosylase